MKLQAGDVVKLGKHKLFVGDAHRWLQILPKERVDLVVTSPPYGEIRDYKKGEWTLDLHKLGQGLYRVMKIGGIVVMVTQDQTKDFAKSLSSFSTIVDWCSNEVGFRLFECLIYARHGRPGAWWSKRFRVDHEYMPVFLKGPKPNHFDKEHLKIDAKHAGIVWYGTQRMTSGKLVQISPKRQDNLKCRGTIWGYPTSSQERASETKLRHPSTFPDLLVEDHIRCWTEEGDIVLDPLAGSGATLIMAEKCNRKALVIEINPEYCMLTVKRFVEETGQKAKLITKYRDIYKPKKSKKVAKELGRASIGIDINPDYCEMAKQRIKEGY